MIGLLDPAFFLPRSTAEVQEDFDSIIQMCRRHAIELPALSEYWGAMWAQLGHPLEQRVDRGAKSALREIRQISARSNNNIPQLGQNAGSVWVRGFQLLFGQQYLGRSWEANMAAAAVRAVASGSEVVMLVRRVPGRNIAQHAGADTVLHENLRWVLHVQPQGIGHRQILCVHHPRNLQDRWTARFDWRLPGALQNGPRYPFCPPNFWWKGGTVAWRTVSSKPAWVDKHGNGWARPNIPGGAGYHWDVFIGSVPMRQAVGLDQINVVEYGAPSKEGAPGEIHHLPDEKASRPPRTGWRC